MPYHEFIVMHTTQSAGPVEPEKEGAPPSQPPAYNKGGLETAAPCTSVSDSAERRPTKDHRDRECEGARLVEPAGEAQIKPSPVTPATLTGFPGRRI